MSWSASSLNKLSSSSRSQYLWAQAQWMSIKMFFEHVIDALSLIDLGQASCWHSINFSSSSYLAYSLFLAAAASSTICFQFPIRINLGTFFFFGCSRARHTPKRPRRISEIVMNGNFREIASSHCPTSTNEGFRFISPPSTDFPSSTRGKRQKFNSINFNLWFFIGVLIKRQI